MSSGDQLDDPIKFTVPQVTEILRHPVVERMMLRLFKIDVSYDIPYVAGYSQDGTIIYIDRDVPKTFEWAGRQVLTSKFLCDHEHTEKSVIDAIREARERELQRLLILLRMTGPDDQVYYHAHGVATTFEEYDVTTNIGPSGLKFYNDLMVKQVKRAGEESIKRVPAELDMTPYRGNDKEDLRLRVEMHAAMAA